MNYCFFITEHGYFLSHDKNKKGKNLTEPIIFKVPMTLRAFSIKDIEGPFFSLKYLKENSKIFLKYKNIDHILEDSNIHLLTDKIELYRGETLKLDFIELLLHLAVGTYDYLKNSISGFHLYSENKINITKIINIHKSGAFNAEFEVFNPFTSTYIPKKGFCSFFPNEWNTQKLFEELKFALKDVKKLESSKSKYLGFSSCGMPILFIIVNENLKTAYPYIE